ncbi:hypothetical protein M569_16016, partial [Genlisea aurea]
SESDSDSDEDVKLTEPSKAAVYDRDGLIDKLEDIKWDENIDWLHNLSFDIDQDQKVDVNDDLTREVAFYTQALEGARRAFTKFQSAGLPFLRPSDYYAEMVKSDTHMEKVKVRLLSEKKKLEEAEERKKARVNKKMAKEIQSQKLKERAKQKKEDIESVKNWRKQRKQSGFAKDEEPNFDFEDGKPFQRSGKKRVGFGPGDRFVGKSKQQGGGGKKRKGKDFKNSKFGFGGRKGLKKQNTSETTNDFRSFSRNNSSKNKK